MDRLRRIVGNTFISLLGQVVTWTSTLVLTIAYGRFLSDTAFGELYLAIAFVALVGFPLEFGFNQQLTRDVAQEPEKAQQYLSNILLLKVCFWIVLFALILLLSFLLGYRGEEIPLIIIAGVSLLADAIANVFSSLHYALERVTFPVVGGILQKGLSALIGTIFLKHGAGVEVMALILLGSSFVNTFWQAIWGLRAVGLPFAFNGKLIVHLLRTCIPFLVYGVLAVIYYRIDTVLLSFMTNAEVIGWYGAAYRLLDTLNFLPNLIIFSIMYPIFAKFSLNDKANLKLAIEKSMNFLLLCGMPIATLMIVAAPNIIGFLYHQEQYIHSVPALQMLAPGLLFLYANTVLGSLLMSIKLEKKITVMAAIALVFNLGLNLVLIPRYEHVGAAAVTSLTEFLLLCLSIAFTPREFLPFKSLITGAKSLLACLAMSLAIWKLLDFNVFVILPVGIVVYGAVILLSGAVPREDFTLLLQAVRQKAAGPSASDAEPAEQSDALEQMMQLADEDTIPMKAVYRLQQLQPNIDLAVLDTLQLKAVIRQPPAQRSGTTIEDEDTWRLKANGRKAGIQRAVARRSGSLEEERPLEKEEGEVLPLKSRVLEEKRPVEKEEVLPMKSCVLEEERPVEKEEGEVLPLKSRVLEEERPVEKEEGEVLPLKSRMLEEERPVEKEEGEVLPLKSRVLKQIGQDIAKLIEDTNVLEEDESMDTVPSRVIRRPKKEVGTQQTLKE